MKFKTWGTLALVVVCCCMPVLGEDKQKQASADEKAMMEQWQKYMTPGDAHRLLDNLVGTFDVKVSSWMQPGQPPMVSTGVSENKWVLGGRYVEQTFNGSFMNMPFEGVGYTGYDNAKKQYFGTWMDNMSTGVMTSSGSTADKGKTWTFKSVATDPMTGKDMPGESRLTIADRDHQSMEMWGAGPDGKTYKMMQLDYTRKK